MRILILNWKDPGAPGAGGAELYGRRLAEIWTAQGHSVSMFVPQERTTPAEAPIRGVTCIRHGNRLTVFRHAREHLRRHGAHYDAVVESVSTRPFFAHEIVGDKAIALYHQMARNVWSEEFRPPLSWAGQHVAEPRWARRMRDAVVVAVSASTAADLGDHGVQCESIVPPGSDVPVAEFRPSLSASPRLLHIGRLVRTKRALDAVAAFDIVRDSLPGATLDVIGSGYLHARVAARAGPGVTVHGYVDASVKERLLRRAHLMLLPGTREGWGIVAIEAMRCGVPVVAYDVPGLRDAVAHGRTGLLTGCTPGELARAAVSLLSDPGCWHAMSAAARERGRELSWERAAGAVMEVMTRPVRCDRAAISIPA